MFNKNFFPNSQKEGYHLTKNERITIQTLSKKGIPANLIAMQIGCKVETVRFWQQRNETNNKFGQGRPEIYSRKEKRLVVRTVKKNPHKGLKSLLPTINKNLTSPIPYRSANRILHRAGGEYKKPPTGQILSKDEKKKRYIWAKKKCKRKSWNGKWFHDESFFSLDKQNFSMWCFPDTPPQKTQKHFQHLKFEAFISREGKSELYFFEGRRTGAHLRGHFNKYLPDLRKLTKRYRFDKFTIYFDRASSHTAFDTQTYLENQGVDYHFFCPRPCEVNVIERVWAIIKNAVRQENPKTLVDAKSLIIKKWRKLNRETLRKLFDEVPERINAIIEAKGGKTKYWTEDKN